MAHMQYLVFNNNFKIPAYGVLPDTVHSHELWHGQPFPRQQHTLDFPPPLECVV